MEMHVEIEQNEIERSDAELVELFRGGDRTAYCELVTRYADKAHRLALRITRNQEDTEEILQDVFITVFNKIHMFEGKSAFSSWLYRVTANTSFMKLRKRRQNFTMSLEDARTVVRDEWSGNRSDSSDVSFISSRHELRHELEEALAQLPEEYRLIFILRDMDGLSNQEVGDVLNLSVPAVKSRLHRSRLMLRKSLQRFYEDYVSQRISYGPIAYTNGLADQEDRLGV